MSARTKQLYATRHNGRFYISTRPDPAAVRVREVDAEEAGRVPMDYLVGAMGSDWYVEERYYND